MRHIGHSEQASEQDLHTARSNERGYKYFDKNCKRIGKSSNKIRLIDSGKIGEDLQQKCRHGSRIAAVGDSKHTLQTWELASPFPRYLSSFSFISCMRA